MPIKKLTLGICLLFAGQALAQTRVYTVRNGDTISGIASRLNVSQKAIIRANGLKDRDSLHLGQKLTIPNATVFADKASHRAVAHSGGNYVVRSGENDWIIAHRLGVTTGVIHQLNPGVRWGSIQPGQKLVVPQAAVAVASLPRLHSRFAVIQKDAVVVRRGPSVHKEAIVTVPLGTRVTVLDRDGSWYQLRFPKGTEGWVRGDMLRAVSAPQVAAVSRRRLTAMPVAHSHSRHRVRYASEGGNGIRLASDPVDEQNILKSAKQYRGVRYVWGGMSRSGTDCSGFTSQVYRTRGYRLPRTSREQATVGNPVHGQLQPGDLVFFKTTRANRISHVGIYVGSGNFIHASSGSGRVQYSSLREGYYRNRFAAARRIVKNKKVAARSARTRAESPVVRQTATGPIDAETQ